MNTPLKNCATQNGLQNRIVHPEKHILKEKKYVHKVKYCQNHFYFHYTKTSPIHRINMTSSSKISQSQRSRTSTTLSHIISNRMKQPIEPSQ